MSTKSDFPELQQLEFFAIPSPCIGVCQVNTKGFCQGCYRSREERLYWAKVDDATKRIIIQACQRRAKRSSNKTPGSTQNDDRQQDLF
ncbi:DUF1289 domain-containing protein [Alteromonas oceanisediminis]|uniref:DUF1289 domain-containing protein n=1 Tax=Alteromonas oceanisediminis TaxID=2836180 RepID=UPI001BDB34E7|nr:DUF1289 domain-containing protein [Alteromonas oceanisediminis]MBT0585553.1 DUF1289 domain-containing protein [Alteromonas oceanisediminis]